METDLEALFTQFRTEVDNMEPPDSIPSFKTKKEAWDIVNNDQSEAKLIRMHTAWTNFEARYLEHFRYDSRTPSIFRYKLGPLRDQLMVVNYITAMRATLQAQD